MAIRSFAYRDTLRNWSLNRVYFDDLNLLVGYSGVGKTWILNAIDQVRGAASKGTIENSNAEWSIDIELDDDFYVWEGRTQSIPVMNLDQLEEDDLVDSYRRQEPVSLSVFEYEKLALLHV